MERWGKTGPWERRSDDDEPDHDNEAGLEECLVSIWQTWLDGNTGRGFAHFETEAEMADSLRHNCLKWPSFRRSEVTDEMLIEAAQDCYERKQSLRLRQRGAQDNANNERLARWLSTHAQPGHCDW